ncbi:MAG: outer membrane protein transport protein [Deltaproteobacteria bacterium]|nr:outer membrane protein transport protein [Deltaproteobacteria bacterium]
MRRALFVTGPATFLVLSSCMHDAHAGGFEIPDNGTQALGRGGAFTAKADDGTALQYNIAGFAGQRGTRLLLNSNFWFSDYTFQRNGLYPDDPANSFTPWGQRPYPKVTDEGGVFFEPFIAASTDFNYFERWTFALGAFGPSSVGNRTFPSSLGFAPNPARYDIVENKPQVLFATAAASVRALDWLDVGLALHYVHGDLHVSSTTFSDAVARGTGPGQCANVEYQPCDARATLDTTGGAVTASLGVLARPAPFLSLGANVRGPATLETTGDVTTQAPRITPNAGFQPSPATFVVTLPTVVRAGARFVFLEPAPNSDAGDTRPPPFERADIELDGTYEAWGSAQDDGLRVTIPSITAQNPPPGVNLSNIDFITPHHYVDTYSVRLGGAYNVRLGEDVLTLRGGAYHDMSASDPQYTRLDFDTLAKTAGTVGVGFAIQSFDFSVAYAEVFDASRTVTGGELRPVNGTQRGQSVDATGALYPAVNGGTYSGHSRILSAGVTVRFDGLLFRRQASGHAGARP